ncbi:PP2C family protein-serine/threonine phosphatase [Roseimaritima ulvae]|uniref:Serine/threonine phosphatase stp n=1 Tax=Roseimaritima ulvae TaxID=980254 RepID=A0A5B9QVA0_9BACT|nr:protein phosphatase 2C domain-containing protein [Roseimaritima ulvae]QEG41882.1 Serine/threonine phosphatase stp [Roseimaritima ulvae]
MQPVFVSLNGTLQQAEKMSPQPDFDVAGGSHVGRKRVENQDHFLVADLHRQLEIIETDVPHDQCTELYGSPLGRLMVVADGMGGHADGELASNAAVQACARYVLDMTDWFLKLSAANEDDFKRELTDALTEVQKSLFENSSPNSTRMGTTVTMAYIVWPRLYVVHAGDSRCYLLRGGDMQQLTTDHTLAQKLLDDEAITAEQAATSKWRHVLWNCVGGSKERVETEVIKTYLEPGDTVLLCSDGLSGMLSDEQIGDVVRHASSSREASEQLIRQANEAGGLDNISVIVAQYSPRTNQSFTPAPVDNPSTADTVVD